MKSILTALLMGFILLPAGMHTATGKADDPVEEFAPGALGMKVPVITERDQLDEYIGRLIAVRGTAGRSKIPHVAGVQIGCADELRNQEVYAVGILAKWVVTEEDTERMDNRPRAHDGPGIKYKLYFDLSGKIAEARPWPRSEPQPKGE